MSYERHRAQIAAILEAWGMSKDNAAISADVLAWADLHGIDSHGFSMMTEYDAWRAQGRLRLDAEPAVSRETPVSALVDGGGGLGFVPGRLAMSLAIAKAESAGIGAVAVKNSAHFGACGYYAKLASDKGLIGFVTTSVSGIRVPPTGGREAKLGTDPLAFAAPSTDRERPFLLDMATTTVAAGKVRNKANEKLPCPPGWVVDSEGRPSTDPLLALGGGGYLTPLGGTAENSSHKGYGLAVMVNILSSCLSGATLITDPLHTRKPHGMDIGHFFMAIDPGLFRDGEDFERDVSAFCDALWRTKPIDPRRPVQIAGDPERAFAAARRAAIPIAPGLRQRLRAVAEAAGVAWSLD